MLALNRTCVYCRKINLISDSSCKGCGASQGESIIKCKKNEVRFMDAKLIIDYLGVCLKFRLSISNRILHFALFTFRFFIYILAPIV